MSIWDELLAVAEEVKINRNNEFAKGKPNLPANFIGDLQSHHSITVSTAQNSDLLKILTQRKLFDVNDVVKNRIFLPTDFGQAQAMGLAWHQNGDTHVGGGDKSYQATTKALIDRLEKITSGQVAGIDGIDKAVPKLMQGGLTKEQAIDKYLVNIAKDVDGVSAWLKSSLAATKVGGAELRPLMSLKTGPGNIFVGEFKVQARRLLAENPPGFSQMGTWEVFGLFVKRMVGYNAFGGGDPLVLDLNGDGARATSFDSLSARFDIKASLHAQRTQLAHRDDAMLARDLDGDGRITDARELFGIGATRSGYAVLAELDGNDDGTVSALDNGMVDLDGWERPVAPLPLLAAHWARMRQRAGQGATFV